jgi:hypothetical protein
MLLEDALEVFGSERDRIRPGDFSPFPILFSNHRLGDAI